MGNTNSSESNPGCCFAFKNSAAKAGQKASDEFASFWKETKNDKAFQDFAFYVKAWLVKEFKLANKVIVGELTDVLINKVKPYIVEEAVKYSQMSPLVNVLFNSLDIDKNASNEIIINKINGVNDSFVQLVTKTVSDLAAPAIISPDTDPLLLNNPQKQSLMPVSQSPIINSEPVNNMAVGNGQSMALTSPTNTALNDDQSQPLNSLNNTTFNDLSDLRKRTLPSIPR